ncbi:MAG: hypothetical protein ACJ0TD_07585 [Arenicellales bacterium]
MFLLINIVLFTHAEYSQPYPNGPSISPTYLNAADGQRYWQVAINLADKFSFSVPPLWDSRPEYPLARSGPLTALTFSIPIRLVGLDQAAYWIVLFQCFFLYVMALSARGLATPFRANPNIIQGLILFNPNLIGLSHLAQSDLLFAGVFTLLLSHLTRMLSSLPNTPRSVFLTLGLFLGLLTLIRDIGFAFTLFVPVVIIFTIFISPTPLKTMARKLSIGLLSALLVYIVVISPWSIRNHLVFGQLSPVVGQIQQLHYNYSQIVNLKDSGFEGTNEEYISQRINSVLVNQGQGECVDYLSPPISDECAGNLRNAYAIALFSEPKSILASAVTYATIRTLISGGSSRFIEYLGFERSDRLISSMQSFSGLSDFKTYLIEAAEGDKRTMMLIVSCFGFILVTRLAGILGFIYTFYQRPNSRHLQVFHLVIGLFFLGVYFAASTSRFRAPLEPILMLYAAIGLACFTRTKGTRTRLLP